MDENKHKHGTEIIPNNTKYFVIGKTRIKVTEHFQEQGPSLESLLENVITYAAKSK